MTVSDGDNGEDGGDKHSGDAAVDDGHCNCFKCLLWLVGLSLSKSTDGDI